MTTIIDQKAYLQKYLSGRSGDKKKKKKKVTKGKGLKIIDDDLDLSKMQALDGDVDVLGEGEDAPVIAGIIDERPEHVREAEEFSSTKWRVINQDDGFNEKLQIEEIKNKKGKIEEQEVLFGKMYSDSEDENDSKKTTDKSKKHNSDSDLSPPRKTQSKGHKNKAQNSDADLSPPRNSERKNTEKPKRQSRWADLDDTTYRNRNFDNRKSRVESGLYQKKSDSDESPPRKRQSDSKKRNSDSDQSPPRKRHEETYKRQSDSKSKQRGIDSRKRESDSDQSPPRKRQTDSRNKQRNADSRHRQRDSESDQSPPRKRRSDYSPPRKRQIDSNRQRENFYSRNRQRDADSDQSPPRKYRNQDDSKHRRFNDSPPPSNKKMAKTLEGKQAGLQNADDLVRENEAHKRREDDMFRKMDEQVSGRNASTVRRKMGKRETSLDRQRKKEREEKQKEMEEKYNKWGKGLKQVEDQQRNFENFLHEAQKPLARYKDDVDLERDLKDVERTGDPMLEYMREKRIEKGDLPPEKPTFKGNYPPNRFNIRPGYRWDGVDRSNGYEKKYFDQKSKMKAQEEEAYKWSTEDL